MRNYKWLLILLLLLLLGTSGMTLAASKENFETVVLKNGVTLKIKVMKDQPMVSIYAVFPIGTNGEKIKGIAHLLEHLVFRGGSGLTFNDISEATTRRGGHFNGFTSFYTTAYNFVIPKEHYESAFKVFNDCIWGVTLDKNIVEMEKQIIGNELDMDYASQYKYYPVVRYFYPEMFHSKQTMAEITVDDLKNFHRSYYQPENVTYVIAGDVNPSLIRAELEKVHNAHGHVEVNKPQVTALDFPKGNVHEKRNLYPYQFQVLMGYQLNGLSAKERLVLKLLSYMYGTDYKIGYPQNRYKIYNTVTRSVADQDYFGIYYLERDRRLNQALLEEEKRKMQHYFHEFKTIAFEKEVKNFTRMIELEITKSQQTAESAVEYEIQRITNPDNITVDTLELLKQLTKKDLSKVIDKYFSKPPTAWIVVETTK